MFFAFIIQISDRHGRTNAEGRSAKNIEALVPAEMGNRYMDIQFTSFSIMKINLKEEKDE